MLNIKPIYETPKGVKITYKDNGDVKQASIFVSKKAILENNIQDRDKLYVYNEESQMKVRNIQIILNELTGEDDEELLSQLLSIKSEEEIIQKVKENISVDPTEEIKNTSELEKTIENLEKEKENLQNKLDLVNIPDNSEEIKSLEKEIESLKEVYGNINDIREEKEKLEKKLSELQLKYEKDTSELKLKYQEELHNVETEYNKNMNNLVTITTNLANQIKGLRWYERITKRKINNFTSTLETKLLPFNNEEEVIETTKEVYDVKDK